MNLVPRQTKVLLLAILCFFSFAPALGASGQKTHVCVSENGALPGLPYTLEFEVYERSGKQTQATLIVGSALSDLFVLGEVLVAGKTDFGPTGENMDFRGVYFGEMSLSFKTPSEGAKPRSAFLNLAELSPLRELFNLDEVPLLCERY